MDNRFPQILGLPYMAIHTNIDQKEDPGRNGWMIIVRTVKT